MMKTQATCSMYAFCGCVILNELVFKSTAAVRTIEALGRNFPVMFPRVVSSSEKYADMTTRQRMLIASHRTLLVQ